MDGQYQTVAFSSASGLMQVATVGLNGAVRHPFQVHAGAYGMG